MTTVPEPEHEAAQATPAPTGWVNDDALHEMIESRALAFRSDVRRVVVHLNGGEELEVGTAHGREEAVALAREFAGRFDAAVAAGEWPEVGGRFLRPGSIVSIDVKRSD
jgi:hypothetical protein